MPDTHIAKRGTYGLFDLLGPTVEFLSSPDDPDAPYCVMLGAIPPGGSVPLHSHPDVESFYVLSGSVQVWCEGNDELQWREAAREDFVHVPGGARHAFRNISNQPVVEIITATPRLGKFFQEAGRQIIAGAQLSQPTSADFERFLRISLAYGYWNGSPQENARIGIHCKR